MLCPKCGAQLSDSAVICRACGAMLPEQTAATQVPYPSASQPAETAAHTRAPPRAHARPRIEREKLAFLCGQNCIFPLDISANMIYTVVKSNKKK